MKGQYYQAVGLFLVWFSDTDACGYSIGMDAWDYGFFSGFNGYVDNGFKKDRKFTDTGFTCTDTYRDGLSSG